MEIIDTTKLDNQRAHEIHRFELAFYNHEDTFLEPYLKQEFTWKIIGADELQGPKAFLKEVVENPGNWGNAIAFKGVLASRTQASAWGMFKPQNNVWVAYVNVYDMDDTDELRINSITTMYHPTGGNIG